MAENNKILGMDYVPEVDELINNLIPKSNEEKTHRPSIFLARLIQKRMIEKDWTDQHLANELEVDLEVVQLIKMGVIPGDEYDEELIYRIAHILDYHPKNIAQMLGLQRKLSTEQLQEEVKSRNQLAQYFLQQLGEALFETLEDRYTQKIEGNKHLRIKYDEVIDQLQRIVARQRKELKFVEELIKSLESPDSNFRFDVTLENAKQGTSEDLAILDVKQRIKRIKRYFEDTAI